jgi:putative endonuclease
MSESFDFGREAESFAVNYFQSLGYEIIKQNYFYQKAEIDLILKNSNQVVIVEVKARSSKIWTNPEDAVTFKKKKLLISAAHQFILENNLDAEIRFDILALVKQYGKWEVNHIIDAFNAFEL